MKIWKERAPFIVLFLFAMAIFIMAGYYANVARQDGKVGDLNDGWLIKYNDEISEDVSLSSYGFPVAKRGDWIILSRDLPSDLPDNVSMSLHSVYSVTRVYIDGECIYEYGLDRYENGEFLGYGTRFISLPSDAAGKEIKITFYVSENRAFSSIRVPELYKSDLAMLSFYGKLLIPLLVSITLIVVGLCISIVTFFLFVKSYSMERLFCIGIFAISIGCWSICNYNIDILFFDDLKIKTLVEIFGLYLAPIPLLLYFREDVEERSRRWESFIFYLLLLVEIQSFIVAAVCQFTNKVHLQAFLVLFQILIAVSALFGIYLIIADLRKEKIHKILAGGFLLLIVLAGRDLVAFNIAKFISASEDEYRSYIPIGALVFIVAMLVDFISEMRKQMYKTAETAYLTKIAYTDVLTGLYTRRKCEEIFERIDSKSYEFAIYQFDLNNLKTANDDYGHEAGDDLIKRFANILTDVFSNGETVGRMGGDEFIVIVEDSYDYKLQKMLDRVNEKIDEENAGGNEVKISVSAGFARSTEFEEPTANQVYKTADARMYEAKEEYYRSIGHGRRRYDRD